MTTIHSLDELNEKAQLVPVPLSDAAHTLVKGDGRSFFITPTVTRIITLPTEGIIEGEPFEIDNFAVAQDITVESSNGNDIATYRGGKREFVAQQDTPTDLAHWRVAAASQLVGDNGVSLKMKVIDIGDWDMDTDVLATVAHGLTLANIRQVSVVIRRNDNAVYYDFPSSSASNTTVEAATVDTSDIVLSRGTSGFFDDVAFNSTSFNRGWVTIFYVG